MKKVLFFLVLFVCSGLLVSAQRMPPVDTTAVILRKNLDYLASDALMGRNTPSQGLDTAAAYIISYFKSIGIRPSGDSFRQSIGLHKRNLGSQNSFTITSKGTDIEIPIKTGFIPFGFSADTTVESEVVFAGYGITDTANDYDDYQHIDVVGKIVVVLSDAPKVKGDVLSRKLTREEAKASNAINHGAVGFVMVNGPAQRMILKPRGYPWPSLSRFLPDDAQPVEIGRAETPQIAAVHGGEAVIKALWGSVDDLKTIQLVIDEKGNAAAFPFVGVTMKICTNIITKHLPADNVIGFIEGADSVLKKELVVIGAHYDHLGAGKDKGDGSDYIYNGADDNASGTTGVMAIANLFTKQNHRPRRSVMFILFAGEERGLLGSQAYVGQPLWPLKNTVAMINLDMISRNGDSLFLEGASVCPELTEIVKEKNSATNLSLILDHNDLTGGSDHASFADEGVPFIFFISGLHKDYHKVTDNPDQSDALKAAKVAQLGFLTAWQIANENRHYSLKK